MKTTTRIKIAFAVLVAGIFLVYVFLNMEIIQVNLLFARIEVNLALMVLVVFLAGFVVGWTVKAVTGAIHRVGHKSTPGSD